MRFKDRVEAGGRLADALGAYSDKDAVVYALPRGGVVLGYEISRALNVPLDLIITRKIGYPGNPECAVCAVAESGQMICDSAALNYVSEEWIKAEAKREMEEAKRRREVYLRGREPIDPSGKIAILVDDGIATGLTILLAIRELRRKNPKKIVVAVPVASGDAAAKIREEADELVALDVPEYFEAVGAYYQNFPQLEDKQVIELMDAARGGRG